VVPGCDVDDEARVNEVLLLIDSIVSMFFALLSGEIVVSQWTMSFCRGFQSARLVDELDDDIDAVIDDDAASAVA